MKGEKMAPRCEYLLGAFNYIDKNGTTDIPSIRWRFSVPSHIPDVQVPKYTKQALIERLKSLVLRLEAEWTSG